MWNTPGFQWRMGSLNVTSLFFNKKNKSLAGNPIIYTKLGDYLTNKVLYWPLTYIFVQIYP